jgi:F0F1-type ATP synthase membrane subunit b/b'
MTDLPGLPNWQDMESACPGLGDLVDKVTSAAGRAVDSIVSSITNSPTAGTAGGIAAKISASVSAVKAEAEALMEKAKGAVAEVEQTLQEFAMEVQGRIEELQANIEQWMIELQTAVGEIRDQLLAKIAEAEGFIDDKIEELRAALPAWLNKSPEELLNDVINGICDPDVSELGKPTEGTAKKMVPSEAPAVNPAGTEVEVFVPPAKPPLQVNPIVPDPLYIDPETGVTP